MGVGGPNGPTHDLHPHHRPRPPATTATSAYPAGGFAFSWGIEGLAADGLLDGVQQLDDAIHTHLTHRWQTADRILLRRAFTDDLATVAATDRLAEATTLSAEMREGSHRAGRALLGVAVKLGGPLSTTYRQMVSADPRLGHLPVVQALSYRDAGLTLDAAELVSGWTLVTGLVSAATRLGLIGHIEPAPRRPPSATRAPTPTIARHHRAPPATSACSPHEPIRTRGCAADARS